MEKLNLGDIVIFKAENNWLSKSIAYLTNSDVCHAAMVYSKESLVEIGANGPVISKINISSGDGAYILRLNDLTNPQPLIDTANKYLNSNTRYDFPALFTLGLLLIHKKLVPNTKLLTILEHLFAVIDFQIDRLIQKALHHKDRAMVCSQFIYQIFDDCSEEYHIQLKNGSLWSGCNENYGMNTFILADYFNREKTSALNFEGPCPEALTADEIKSEEIEQLSFELYQAMAESNSIITEQSVNSLQSNIASVASLAEKFYINLQHLLDILKCDTPIDSLFVTPADILYHSLNTERLGLLNIERYH